MRAAAVVALVVMTSACSNKDSPLAASGSGSAGSAAGSAAAGSADPWAKGPAPAPGHDAACSDDDINQHIDASLRVSLAYLTALEAKTKKWGSDCEQAKQDLLALEPEATKFMDSMKEFMTWGRGLAPACGKRVAELGDKRPEARDIEARTPALEAKIKPLLEKCQDHPGFNEAAGKGLRVMHRKKPSP